MQITPNPSSNVLVVYAGGTFGMTTSKTGLIPSHNLAQLIVDQLAPTALSQLPSFDIIELSPLIDSANLTPTMWSLIAEPIITHYSDYDGFLVIHGTDTMAYSASALSFMLRGLSKPIVFTGSQIPLGLPRSDAANNFMNALAYAGSQSLQEVCLYFDKQLLRGNRSVKTDAMGYTAFTSPNYPALGHASIHVNLHEKHLWTKNHTLAFNHKPFNNTAVALLKLFPGMDDTLLNALAEQPHCKAIVLSSFGVGNLPTDSATFMAGLTRALDNQKLIINTSQCLAGVSVPGHYACSDTLNSLGIINGADMTNEAAFTKAHVVLANNLHPRELSHNLAGEAALSH